MHLKLLETLGLVSNPEKVSQHFAIMNVQYSMAGRSHSALIHSTGTNIGFTDSENVTLILTVNPIDSKGWPTDTRHQLIGTLYYHEGVLQQVLWHLADGTQVKVKISLLDGD